MPPQHPIHTATFTNGMNADIAVDLLPPDQYRYAENIRILSTGTGTQGVLTNCKGNIEISYELPEGENVTIGAQEDTESNKFYWFNWNENGYHGIYMYDMLLNRVTPVIVNLTDTGDKDILQFQKRSLILHIDIIRSPSLQDLIYWVDGQVKPKKFNIQKALDKSSTGYGLVILPEYINAYKLAAIFPPTLSYFTDTTRETNYLYSYMFKASQRPIFDDGEKGNWSEFSTVPLPLTESFAGNPAISNVNNGLKITVETGSSIVTQIEISVKISDDPFVSVIVLDKERLGISNDTTYEYLFYNDNSSYSGLDQLNVYRAYSFLPKLAVLQSFTRKSMVYGKGIEGFEALNIDVSVTGHYSPLFLDSDVENQLNDPFFQAVLVDYDFTRQGPGRRRNSLITITVGHDVKEGNIFTLYGRNGQSDNLSWTYTATNADDAVTVANEFKQRLVATGRIISTSEELPPTDIWTNTINVDGDVTFSFIWYGVSFQNATQFEGQVTPVSFQVLKNSGQSVLTQKSGGSIKYGIIYWDDDTRRSNTYTSDECFIRNDFVTQTDGYKKIVHEISIMHRPPVWAKYWELTRTLDLTYGSDFIHILIQKSIESTSTATVEYVDLIIGSLYTYQEMYPNTIVQYTFEKNDRVRLIKKENTGIFYDFIETVVLDFKEVGTTDTINEDVTTNNTSTVTIGGTTSEDNIGRYIVIDDVERLIVGAPTGTTYTLDRAFGTAQKYPSFKIVDKRGIIRVRKPISVTIEDNSLIEVYKPTQNVESTEKQFYLFGQKFAVTDWGTDNRAHSGNVQNQDPANLVTVPAIVQISKGTTYVRNRQLPTNNQIPGTQVKIDLIEDASYSDFYVSDLNDNGKISPEDDGSGEKRFGSRLRFSNNYIEGTRINGLNDFDNNDREDYNDPYGDFMLLKFRESFLFSFKQLKVGYIPILANIITDENNQQILGTSDKLLNKLQYFAWEGGIGNNPESYTSNQTWQWFLSPNSGADCRIGGDGVLPVSEQFFLDTPIQQYINLAVKYNTFVFGGFDRENNERLLSFENYNEYLYNSGFEEPNWQLYSEDLPNDTEYEIVTQPLHGTVVIDLDGFFVYTPDSNSGSTGGSGSDSGGYTGPDYFYYRWRVPGGEWSAPKKECGMVNPANIPLPPDVYYNDELIVPFTRDDCNPGYHGSVVNYIVEALTYASFFSQADADQQAVDDAEVSGQAFANDPENGGTCTINDPDPFAFTDLTGLEINTLTESNAIVVSSDYDDYVISISGTGAQYQINGGSWTSVNGIVEAGDSVKIRRTTSGSYSTAVTAILTIGSVSDTWSITTRAAVTVPVNWQIIYGLNPVTPTALIIARNGVTTNTIQFEGSGTISNTYFEGDTIAIYQVAYAAFKWAPDSNANLNIELDNVEVYDGDVTDQTPVNLQDYDFVIPDGSTSIDVVSTGSSDAEGYLTKTLSVDTELPNEEVRVKIDDDTTGTYTIDVEPNTGLSQYSFNIIDDVDTLTVTVYNNSAVDIQVTVTGEGGYAPSPQVITPGNNYVFTNAPKGSIDVVVIPDPV